LITECDGKSFEDTVTRAKQLEQITADVEDIIPDRNEGKGYLNKYQQGSRPSYKKEGFEKPYRQDDKTTKVHSNYTCIRCTTKGKHLAKECFALKLKCNKCGKLGHISKACKSKGHKKEHPHKANHIDEAYEETPPEEFDAARFFNVKRIQKSVPKVPDQLSTRNRYQGLQEHEEDWPKITDHTRFRYVKREGIFKRKDQLPYAGGSSGTTVNKQQRNDGNKSCRHFLGKSSRKGIVSK
jgi:hypothetical protein